MSHPSPQIEAMLREQAEAIGRPTVATTADTWPIVKINVHEGRIILAEFYAPGLPDGEHDLWPVRVTLTEEDEALAKAAEALVRAADKCAAEPVTWTDAQVFAVWTRAGQLSEVIHERIRAAHVKEAIGAVLAAASTVQPLYSSPSVEPPPQVEPAGWVRPSERMPNEGQFVFAAVHEWDQASAPLTVAHGQYKGDEWLACGEDQGTLYTPVFWMPAPPGIRLPAPPKDHP